MTCIMTQFVSGAHIGTSAGRKDFYLNARDANEPKDNIRAGRRRMNGSEQATELLELVKTASKSEFVRSVRDGDSFAGKK